MLVGPTLNLLPGPETKLAARLAPPSLKKLTECRVKASVLKSICTTSKTKMSCGKRLPYFPCLHSAARRRRAACESRPACSSRAPLPPSVTMGAAIVVKPLESVTKTSASSHEPPNHPKDLPYNNIHHQVPEKGRRSAPSPSSYHLALSGSGPLSLTLRCCFRRS
jgi:hypothetical protein